MSQVRTAGKLVAIPLAVGAAIVGAWTVFACTLLPSLSLNQAYSAAGGDVSVTGSAWTIPAPVTLHWDSLSGPVLATVTPHPGTGLIGPVTVHVPSTAQPGFHVIVATDNTYSADTARVPFQVLGNGASVAAPPQAVLSTTSGNQSPVGVGAPVVAILAAAGVAGIALSTVGATALVRVRARRRVAVSVERSPRQR